MAITPAEGMLFRFLLDAAIMEITKKIQKMTPEEVTAATPAAETKTKELMKEVRSH